MLTEIADGVWTHRSEWIRTSTVVVQGAAGVLVIDPGIHEAEILCLVSDLAERGRSVVAGFSTHPHWDHLLWHAALGDVPRYATDLCATTIRDKLATGIDVRRAGAPDDVSLDLLGLVTGLPAGTTHLPWDGPPVRVIEHRAHAAGHAALVIEPSRVLVAGDMLSDVLIPMLDVYGSAEPVDDYLTALGLLDDVAADVDVAVPGHGSPGAVRARIEQDRAYVQALRDGKEPDDPRIGPAAEPGWEFVADVHQGQVDGLRG